MTPTLMIVVCADCGESVETTSRNALDHERPGLPHRCVHCRYPHTRPTQATNRAGHNWWLARYSLEELRRWPPL